MKPSDLLIENKHVDTKKVLHLVPHAVDNRSIVLRTGPLENLNETFYFGSSAIWLNIDEIFQLRNKLNEWLIHLERRSNTERRG